MGYKDSLRLWKQQSLVSDSTIHWLCDLGPVGHFISLDLSFRVYKVEITTQPHKHMQNAWYRRDC